ncbi:MAG: DUF6345 domain-containing protein [Verrucomicrobiae bacterium]|nr:DUF6345 domain-containing protein [Verrucomicrobiae bacterium]
MYTRASYSSTNYVNTTEWPNGQHEIYAVAITVDAGESIPGNNDLTDTNAAELAIGISAPRIAVFSNDISQFFVAVPFFEAGQTQEVVAKFEEDSYWRVKVVNYQNVEVRRFEGRGSSCYAAWDGTDELGNPLPYGFYDYLIEARPSNYGPLSLMGTDPHSAVAVTEVLAAGNDCSPLNPAADYKRTQPAMQFSRTSIDVKEVIASPSLNPVKEAAEKLYDALVSKQEKPFPSSPEEALIVGLTSYFVEPPPMPPILKDGEWVQWEEIYGVTPPIEIQIPYSAQEAFPRSLTKRDVDGDADGPKQASWDDQVYTTRTPNRIPGNLFFGFAGTVGIGYQGHHPKSPPFAQPPGGKISLSDPPYGPLRNASTIAEGFSVNLGLGGWRTSFLLGDDNLNSTNLSPILGPGSGTGTFATKCNFGLLVGHMTAAARTDPNYFTTHSYYPVYSSYQPGAYQWIPLPAMDFGNGSINSKLRWMAIYGCNSLRQQDFIDLWAKFLLPMPPNLRLLLGAETGVYMHPIFGWRFAANLHGWTSGGNPMTIKDAWYDASAVAHAESAKTWKVWKRPGTTVMTVVYRDTTQGGTWNTLNDRIWQWGTGVSLDWFDISLDSATVYEP